MALELGMAERANLIYCSQSTQLQCEKQVLTYETLTLMK